MSRFFINLADIGATHIALDAETLAHIRVLRLGVKEQFIVSDGRGTDYCCVLAGDRAEILHRIENAAEPGVSCTVYLAFTRGERMDYAIQKSVELGADAVTLFPATRCVVRYDDKSLPKKLARWEKIALEAAKQSGRGKIPAVTAASNFQTAMTDAAGAALPLFFYENEAHLGFREALGQRSDFKTAALVIGPEGGFTEGEAAEAVSLGLRTVSLGRRILRAETAPVAALAVLMFYSGEL